MAWDPSSITSSQISDLRRAAEASWADDTCHEAFIGHPQSSAGQCYVTSAWLTSKLGGHVGTKNGHYFWVSPDKSHVLDLAGDQFAYPPTHPDVEGKPLDAHDEDWQLDPYQKTWRAGPAMYKRADHPLWKGFRVIPEQPDHQRAQLFARRADAVLRGGKTASYHQADLLGADPYPGSTPQKQEDWDQTSILLHDEPNNDPGSELGSEEFRWVLANGQLHVSPLHSHEELSEHAGFSPESQGPFAAGYVEVNQNHALWQVESNMSLRGLQEILENYTDTVGWKWEGMVGADGSHLHDDFGPKKSMWYRMRNDGHMVLSATPLPNAKRISIRGKTAYVTDRHEGLEEWARDFGYRLSEYPGGGDMLDKMKPQERLDTYNRGDMDWQPERDNPDLDPGPVKCGECGEPFASLAELRLHHRDHESQDSEEIEDGHFPEIDDFDAPLPFRRRQPFPNQGETIARTAVMVLPNHRVASRFPRFDLYAGLFNYAHDDNLRFYGAYRHGQLVGYGAVRLDGESEPEVLMVDTVRHRSGIGSAILSLIQTHFDSFYTHADSIGGERLMRRLGVVNVKGHRWRWAKGEEPKDLIEAAIPFIYDINGDEQNQDGIIKIGYPGQQTADIPGKFTPGGIIEGYYEPGGKIVFFTATNMPYSLHHFANLWYHLFPQMEITSMEMEGADGKSQKLASEDIGSYLRTLMHSDDASRNAYQALRDAGGKVYVVGGAVRDALQQREPKDLDLMVAGLPAEQVSHLLESLPGRVDLTGKRFGVYRYRVNGQEVEVALPRTDLYEESRRGKGVITVDHNLPIERDLERRDFTANSMAVDAETGKLIDPYGGARDIEQNILRTTHPDSFKEDPTRLVRALAAHSRFGLIPEERTRHEMEAHGHLLRHESPDALNKITDKLFAAPNPAAGIRLAHETQVLPHLFPEVAQNYDFDQNNGHHSLPLGEHLLHVLHNVSEQSTDPDLRLAGLYHDVGKPASEWRDDDGISHYYEGPNGEGADHAVVGAKMTEDRMRALNYPVARINRVKGLVYHHMFPTFTTSRGARRFLQRVGNQADDLLTLRGADRIGKGYTLPPAEMAELPRMRELVDQARTQQAPTDLANLSVNGNDLIAMGVPAGPAIGEILRHLVDDVVAQPSLNDRSTLLQRAQTYVNALPE